MSTASQFRPMRHDNEPACGLLGSDFTPDPVRRHARCGECGKKMRRGEVSLVSVRDGKVRKRVCGENCRLEFDDRMWQGVADKRARKNGDTDC